MTTKTSPWDVAEHLRTPEEMAAYLEACIDEADGEGLHCQGTGGHRTGPRDDPGGQRLRAIQGEPLQSPLRGTQPEL